MILETEDPDSSDYDGDSDFSELVYGFAFWKEVDGTSQLGSMARDAYYLLP